MTEKPPMNGKQEPVNKKPNIIKLKPGDCGPERGPSWRDEKNFQQRAELPKGFEWIKIGVRCLYNEGEFTVTNINKSEGYVDLEPVISPKINKICGNPELKVPITDLEQVIIRGFRDVKTLGCEIKVFNLAGNFLV